MSQPPHRPRTTAPRTHPGWWAAVGVLAAVLIGLAVYMFVFADSPETEPTPQPSSSPSDTPDPGPSPTPEPSPEPSPTPEPSPSPSPTLDRGEFVHGSPGHWLDPRYAGGAETITVSGGNTEAIGASADGSIFAVVIDDVASGIDVATGEVVWEHPTYRCAEGAWNGIALCSDIADPQPHFETNTGSGLIGLDLATGAVVHEVAVEVLPTSIEFVGEHDGTAYFVHSDRAAGPGALFGTIGVLGIDATWAPVLQTDLGLDDVPSQLALMEGGRLAISYDYREQLALINLADGSVTDTFEGSFMYLHWDGFSDSPIGEDQVFFDWDGAEVGTSALGAWAVEAYPNFPGVTPVLSLDALEIGQHNVAPVEVFMPDGHSAISGSGSLMLFAEDGTIIDMYEPLNVDAGGTIVAVRQLGSVVTINSIADGTQLAELSADQLTPEIHDGFITSQNSTEEDGALVSHLHVMLPRG